MSLFSLVDYSFRLEELVGNTILT